MTTETKLKHMILNTKAEIERKLTEREKLDVEVKLLQQFVSQLDAAHAIAEKEADNSKPMTDKVV